MDTQFLITTNPSDDARHGSTYRLSAPTIAQALATAAERLGQDAIAGIEADASITIGLDHEVLTDPAAAIEWMDDDDECCDIADGCSDDTEAVIRIANSLGSAGIVPSLSATAYWGDPEWIQVEVYDERRFRILSAGRNINDIIDRDATTPQERYGPVPGRLAHLAREALSSRIINDL